MGKRVGEGEQQTSVYVRLRANRYVYCMNNYNNNTSDTIRASLDIAMEVSYIVYEFECTLNGKVYFGMIDKQPYFHNAFLVHLYDTGYPCSTDLKNYGINEFKYTTRGLFPSIREAMAYRDFLMNRALDSGRTLYNDEIMTHKVPRYITIFMGFNQAKRVINYCITEKLNFDKFLTSVLMKRVRKLTRTQKLYKAQNELLIEKQTRALKTYKPHSDILKNKKEKKNLHNPFENVKI